MLHHYQERRGEKLPGQDDACHLSQCCVDPHVAVERIRTYIQARNSHNLGNTYYICRSSPNA
jgi:hypothetical protein